MVFLWDVEHGSAVRRWNGHGGRVEAVEFCGEGDSVVVSGLLLFFFLNGVERECSRDHYPMDADLCMNLQVVRIPR